MDKEVIDKIKEIIREDEYVASHDYYHLERVYKNVETICKYEMVSEERTIIVMAAALLHDISKGKTSYKETDNHELDSAKKAGMILRSLNVQADEISMVVECIANHRASKKKEQDNLYINILRDADRLDALGAIAIARTFSYDSDRPIYLPDLPPKKEYDGVSLSSMNHIVEKILKLTPDTFYTNTAHKIAEKRLEFTQRFVDEFMYEWHSQ